MVEKVFDFHNNRIADNMVIIVVGHKTIDNMDYNVEEVESMTRIVVEVANKIVENMDYNVEVVESRAHIVAETAYKTMKVVAANMRHNASQNCKFVQLILFPF